MNALLNKTVAAMGLTLLLGLSSAELMAAPPGNLLKGTWEITGNPDPTCNVPPFVNLAVISRDGTIVNVDPFVGTAVGQATRTGLAQFDAAFFGFINDAGAIGRYEVLGTLTLVDPNQVQGTFTATIIDPVGNSCTYGGTIAGSRLTP